MDKTNRISARKITPDFISVFSMKELELNSTFSKMKSKAGVVSFRPISFSSLIQIFFSAYKSRMPFALPTLRSPCSFNALRKNMETDYEARKGIHNTPEPWRSLPWNLSTQIEFCEEVHI